MDTTRSDLLDIYLDITFHHLPCDCKKSRSFSWYLVFYKCKYLLLFVSNINKESSSEALSMPMIEAVTCRLLRSECRRYGRIGRAAGRCRSRYR